VDINPQSPTKKLKKVTNINTEASKLLLKKKMTE